MERKLHALTGNLGPSIAWRILPSIYLWGNPSLLPPLFLPVSMTEILSETGREDPCIGVRKIQVQVLLLLLLQLVDLGQSPMSALISFSMGLREGPGT